LSVALLLLKFPLRLFSLALFFALSYPYFNVAGSRVVVGSLVIARFLAVPLSEELRGLGKADREVHSYKDDYQQHIHEIFVSR
jgi:hypothetical protein